MLNLNVYESTADNLSTSQLKGKYTISLVNYCSGSKEYFQFHPEICFIGAFVFLICPVVSACGSEVIWLSIS